MNQTARIIVEMLQKARDSLALTPDVSFDSLVRLAVPFVVMADSETI
jgi:hypothetical protein